MAEIVLIAALAETDRVIGRGLDLPWRIPADLRRFKRLTTGHPLVMGRRTFASLVHQFGGPLPGRPHAVLTRHPEAVRTLADGHPAVRFFPSLDDALAAHADAAQIFVAGGGDVYAEALGRTPPLPDRLELTLVEGTFEGDTHFPPYEHLLGTAYRLAASERHAPEGDTPGFRFETWVRTDVRPRAPQR